MKSSLFVLMGDPFLCEEKRKEILDSFQKEFGSDLALTVRRAGEVPVQTLLSEARTLPFLCRAQVFCLRDADQFTAGDGELWNSYFQSPHPQTFFIFEVSSLDKDHPLLEWARRSGQIFSLEPQREKMVTDFIQRKLKQSGKQITAEALGLLESRVGESNVFLDTLLDQLILYSGEKPEIDRLAVEALDEKLLRFEGFDLIQALGEKNFPKALEILDDLLELSGQDAPSLVGLLHWQLRRLWEAKRGLAKGASEREVAARLRLFASRDSLFFKSLRRFSLLELEEILEGLFELDWQLKTGRAEGRYEIETWLGKAIG